MFRKIFKMFVVAQFIGLFCLLNQATTNLHADWGIQTVDSAGDVGQYISIALDKNNNPHISYRDGTNGDLKYSSWTGVSWSTQTVHSAGDVGYWTSIAIDSNNYTHISYSYLGTDYDLKYAKWNGSSWSIETVESAGDVGYWTSIAIDTNNNPHISYNYYDGTNLDLKYSSWTGVSWSTSTVDSAWMVGEYTSIALDTNNNPHISYRDYTNNDLKYSSWTGVSWSTQTVDSAGIVGRFTSITLDSNNNPHISYSYYDGTNWGLKYAKWTPLAPAVTYYIKGYVKDSGGTGITGVTMNLTGADVKSATTDSAGKYEFLNLSTGNYTATPTKSGYTFTPVSRSTTSLSANISDWDFVGTYSTPVVITTTTVTQPGEIKIIGGTESKGAVNPDKGENVKIDFRGDSVGKFECRIFTLTGELVYEETKENMSSGRFNWIPKNIASGIYIVSVKGPGINVHKKVAILR